MLFSQHILLALNHNDQNSPVWLKSWLNSRRNKTFLLQNQLLWPFFLPSTMVILLLLKLNELATAKYTRIERFNWLNSNIANFNSFNAEFKWNSCCHAAVFKSLCFCSKKTFGCCVEINGYVWVNSRRDILVFLVGRECFVLRKEHNSKFPWWDGLNRGPFLVKIVAVISYHCFFNLSIECAKIIDKQNWNAKLTFFSVFYHSKVTVYFSWATSLNRLLQALEKLLEIFSVLHLNFFQESLVGNIYILYCCLLQNYDWIS